MTTPRVSIISVYNDRDVLEEMLLSSLDDEPEEFYETVLLDNRNGEFPSAAEALNAGTERASGDVYVFVHQDVYFRETGWVRQIHDAVDRTDGLGVAGISGLDTEGPVPHDWMQNSILHGPDKEPWGHERIDSPEPVQTIDELCIVVPAQVFDECQFDEDICSGWHLYAVEYSLRINYRTDLQAYVLPIDVWHGSKGQPMGTSYYRTLGNLADEYDEVRLAYTTCGYWYLNRRIIDNMIRTERLIEAVPHSGLRESLRTIVRLGVGGGIPILLEEGPKSLLRAIVDRYRTKRGGRRAKTDGSEG